MNQSFSSTLKSLNLNFNLIKVLPEQARFPNLEALYLSRNIITVLPDELYKCVPKLEILCMFENRLESLPRTLASLRNLTRLRSLDLSGNPCAAGRSYRYQCIRSLHNLKELDGDVICWALERDLADMYFQRKVQRPSSAPASKKNNEMTRKRPSFVDRIRRGKKMSASTVAIASHNDDDKNDDKEGEEEDEEETNLQDRIDELEEEIKMLRGKIHSTTTDKTFEEIIEINQRLERENANVTILHESNVALRSEVAELQKKLKFYDESSKNNDITSTLRENERLQEENKRLRVELARARLVSTSSPKKIVKDASKSVSTHHHTNNDDDEDSLMDAELEMLIMRNEASLKELRQGLSRMTKSQNNIGPENSTSPLSKTTSSSPSLSAKHHLPGSPDTTISSPSSPCASFYEGVMDRKRKFRELQRRKRPTT